MRIEKVRLDGEAPSISRRRAWEGCAKSRVYNRINLETGGRPESAHRSLCVGILNHRGASAVRYGRSRRHGLARTPSARTSGAMLLALRHVHFCAGCRSASSIAGPSWKPRQPGVVGSLASPMRRCPTASANTRYTSGSGDWIGHAYSVMGTKSYIGRGVRFRGASVFAVPRSRSAFFVGIHSMGRDLHRLCNQSQRRRVSYRLVRSCDTRYGIKISPRYCCTPVIGLKRPPELETIRR